MRGDKINYINAFITYRDNNEMIEREDTVKINCLSYVILLE